MILRKSVATAGLAVAGLLLAACGGGNADPLAAESAAPSASSAGAAPIVVGSAGFTESQILAEVYAQALNGAGVSASTKLSIGPREIYIRALQDKSISVVPEYTGNLLQYLDDGATATTAEEIEAALPAAMPPELKVLKSSPAADQDVYVVTKEFSEKNGVTSLADLAKVASTVTLGGPSELESRDDYGPAGLEKLYGAKIKEFKPYDSPAVKTKDLLDGKIQLATYFTTESVIADNGLVMLADPEGMIRPQNVIPLVRAEVADNATAVSTLEAVQAALTTEQLTALNKKVDSDRQDPDQVADEWLTSKGLA